MKKALLKSLVCYWKMDELTGSRIDWQHANHLTDNNGVGSAEGVIWNAARFIAASSQSLSVADNSATAQSWRSIATGDIDFTFSAWVYHDSKVDGGIIAKDGAGANREYFLNYSPGADRFQCAVFRSGGFSSVIASSSGSLSTATWYFIVFWYDATANTLNIQVNNGPVDSVAAAGPLQAGTAPLRIGARAAGASPAFFMDGRIDEVAFWKRVLTSDERAEIYTNTSWFSSRAGRWVAQ